MLRVEVYKTESKGEPNRKSGQTKKKRLGVLFDLV